MNKEDKAVIIAELTEQFTTYNNVYVSDSSGLTAAADNSLRRELYKNGIKMIVAKNTLIQKAMENSGRDFTGLFGTLKGTSALMFSNDMKAPANAIKSFRKKGDKPALKGAWIDSDVFLGDASLEDLLKLKSKNELIGEIIGLLQSPAKNVVSGLQSGGNKLAGIIKTLSERAS